MRHLRLGWRRLTSMRTALVLLFLLAVAAVPGSLLPQKNLNPAGVDRYVREHGAWGRFLRAIGMFDVFGAPWFAAVYLLLAVSLIGCLIPRIRVHARAVARAPLPAPRHLDRLPESGSFETALAVDDYAATARRTLGRRWRIVRREDGEVVTLSAEKGYSRETGNLVFHVALLVSLLLIAVGKLYSYEGQVIVKQGEGFCNSVTSYDEWKPGRLAADGRVRPAPFCVGSLQRFSASYTDKGEPRRFAATIDYGSSVERATKRATITVNNPLRYEGDRIYLTGHGYAPKITVRMPDGETVTSTKVFLPSNASTLFSEGVYALPGPDGAKQDVGITGFFAPTPLVNPADGTISSASPAVQDPTLGIRVFVGDLNETGLPRSIYTIDTSKMTRIGSTNLRIGETERFANGMTVTFDGWVPWANLQVSHDPAQGWLLGSAVAMVLGLAGSLGVRRRRLWLRVSPGSAGVTLVSVGGLARSDSGNFTTEFAALLERLTAAGAAPREALVAVGKD